MDSLTSFIKKKKKVFDGFNIQTEVSPELPEYVCMYIYTHTCTQIQAVYNTGKAKSII